MAEFEPNEQRTFKLHMAYASIEGVILGFLALNEFVFLKSLHGSNYQMGLLFQFSMAVFVALIFISEWIKRIKNRRQIIRIVALTTRLPFLAVLFFPVSADAYILSSRYHIIFLAIFFIYYLGALVINPSINYFLKMNYSHSNFGKLYSYATTVNKIVMMIITFIYGLWLDYEPFAFRYTLALSAILGVVSLWLLSMIHAPEVIKSGATSWTVSVKKSIFEMIEILKVNKAYRVFEIGFMFYGISFMVSVTVIAIYFYEGLDLNYSSVAFYRNAYNILAIILLPFFGKLIGRIDPRKFSVITYGAILFYIIFLLSTHWFPQHTIIFGIKLYYVLILYIIAHGVFASTMVLLWNIGSAYFCEPSEAGSYQMVHLFLTGVRALFAPLVGVLLYESFGLIITFVIALILIVIAIGINLYSVYSSKV